MSKLDEQLITLMLEKLDKTHGIVTSLDKKVDLHVQRTEQEFEAIKVLDEHQNRLLEEHAKRSDRLEQDNKLREQALRLDMQNSIQPIELRLAVIEAPWKWVLTTKKGLIWLATIATAIVGILQAVKLILGS